MRLLWYPELYFVLMGPTEYTRVEKESRLATFASFSLAVFKQKYVNALTGNQTGQRFSYLLL